MLKNYFTIAINNLLKNKLYSAINIIGLSVGLAACIVISLYVKDQYSYDTQWENSDRIYRVIISQDFPGEKPSKTAFAPLPTMPLLKKYYEDKIVKCTRVYPYNMTVYTGTAGFEDKLVKVDPAFTDIFKLDVISGSLENTLNAPGNIALSREAAKRYFGEKNPIGETLTLSVSDLSFDYKITAVYSVSGNTVLDIPLISLLDESAMPEVMTGWYNFTAGSYFLLNDSADIKELKPMLKSFIDQNIDLSLILSNPDIPVSDIISIDFQNIEHAHIDSPWDETRAGGNKTIVFTFAAISALILFIGCINFIILTTAKATQRSKEVAVRKVVGAKRMQLIVQFLCESTFIVLLAMILSMGIVEFISPIFESIVGGEFSVNYFSPSVFLPLTALLFFVGTGGGIYPAFILSGFRPGSILKSNKSRETGSTGLIRNLLVIFQFSISILLIILTIGIYTQMEYCLNRDPGYNKNNLLVINRIGRNSALKDKAEVLKNELLKLDGVSDAGLSELQPSSNRFGMSIIFTRPWKPDKKYIITRTGIGHDYFRTYQIPFISGRDYSDEYDIPEKKIDVKDINLGNNKSRNTINRNIIINESAVGHFGFTDADDAVGKVLNTTAVSSVSYTIIGVVADNHIFRINAPPIASVYLLEPDQANVITIRFKDTPRKIIAQVNSVWAKIMGDKELSMTFVDQLVADEFSMEALEIKILISFSLLAIFIACMGLYGSSSFTVERRIREIGLRKVMGAKVKNIISLLLWHFSRPVLIANIVAWPVAVFAMQYWLERFTYRLNPLLMIPICLVSGLLALVIAWFTVAGNTARVAKSRPIKALRYE